MISRRVLTLPLCALALAAPVACSSDSSSSQPADGPRVTVLVTNDDGVKAPGIDALVRRLQAVPGLDIQVVAPDENKSGSGSKTTPGELPRQRTTTKSGFPATAVTGYPADTVRVALDDLGIRPRIVIAGVNEGQNVGPIAVISGTVGAARAGAQRGIPSIGVSQGIPADDESYDFEVGADYAAQQVQKLLPALTSSPGAAPSDAAPPDTSTVANLNVPSCDAGQVRGLRELQPTTVPSPLLLAPSDCTSTADPTDEGEAFHDGFAVVTRLPARP